MRPLAGVGVRPRPYEPVDRMIRRFLRLVRNSGIEQEARDRRHAVKPSVRRRQKSARARHRPKREREGS